MFVWIFLFLYFLVIDFFIFKQNWFIVILLLLIGFILFLINLIVKLIFMKDSDSSPVTVEKKSVQADSSVKQTTENETKPSEAVSASAPVIEKNSIVAPVLPKKSNINLPLVFFIIEVIIVIGLFFYLYFK